MVWLERRPTVWTNMLMQTGTMFYPKTILTFWKINIHPINQYSFPIPKDFSLFNIGWQWHDMMRTEALYFEWYDVIGYISTNMSRNKLVAKMMQNHTNLLHDEIYNSNKQMARNLQIDTTKQFPNPNWHEGDIFISWSFGENWYQLG